MTLTQNDPVSQSTTMPNI